MSFETLIPIIPPGSIILELNWSGEIINSWHSNSKTHRTYSEGQIIVSLIDYLKKILNKSNTFILFLQNGYMYLASPYNDYLGRIKMPNSIHFVKQPMLTLG